MAVLNESLALKAADLYSQGSTFAKISEEMNVSKGSVGDLIRQGILESKKQGGNSEEDPVVQVEVERVNSLGNEESSLSAYEDNPGLNDAWEKTLLIQATPILRKVVLNSKVFIQHEYFQKHLNYTGDIGDLLIEALNFYWKEMGFTIKITHDSVI